MKIRITKTAKDYLSGTHAGQLALRPPRPLNNKDRARGRTPANVAPVDPASASLMKKVFETESTRQDGTITIDLTDDEIYALLDYAEGWDAAAHDSGEPGEIRAAQSLLKQVSDASLV